MIDYYLVSQDQEEFDSIFQNVNLNEDEYSIDIIGQNPQTIVEDIITNHLGYHVNLRLYRELSVEEHEILYPIVIDIPTYPIRTWA